MVRKKVDERVRTLIENSVKTRHRSLFVLVGDHGKDQVVNLHFILSKARVASRPSVLWCYKKELGFSTHRQKRMRQLKRQKKSGLAASVDGGDDLFELFINSTSIRWCYYRDTAQVLGQTFGMCVLQDFEALTPNLLARTIETVEGGGIVCLLLKTVSTLRQLYTLTMDVHDRFRTEAHGDVVGRFNERFMLTLGDCRSCLICDDELNVLPLSSHAKVIAPLPPAAAVAGGSDDDDGEGASTETTEERELRKLKASLADTPPIGPLVSGARTVDQARALLTFMEAISEKTLRSTVVLTAARGRGKSAAIGLCLAGAVAYGYSNIFVTAPSPENLGTVFEFILKGFDLLKFTEHLDYEVIQSTNPDFNKAVVRINVFRDHRQTIQYIQPHNHEKLSHAELLAIDEAAAIPLPVVKRLLGPYLTFLSSTINGYEGTGRSLSLKLVDQLRRQQGQAAAATAAVVGGGGGGGSGGGGGGAGRHKGRERVHEQRWQAQAAAAAANAAAYGGSGGAGAGRTLREVTLETPIRYGTHDPIETWLHRLLCLDTRAMNRLVCGTPAPSDCELYYVDRDALFSYHKLSEAFLQRIMALYTAAHYKNQPNDLQLMSDAPAHHLFVLLGPRAVQQGESGELPDVLCVLQVALEGEISRASVQASMARGNRASGDLIPWTLSQQFNDTSFPQLSGARVVRIATHPDVQKMGYGTRAMQLLLRYYRGELFEDGGVGAVGEKEEEEEEEEEEEGKEEESGSDEDGRSSSEDEQGAGGGASPLAEERLKPRKKLPPLLGPAGHRRPEPLHWVGASFGVTGPLLRFWTRLGSRLVYLRQTSNDLTGEHTGIALVALGGGAGGSGSDGAKSVGGAQAAAAGPAPEEGWLAGFVEDCRRRLISLLAFEFGGFDTTTALALVYSPQTGVGAGAGGNSSGGAAATTNAMVTANGASSSGGGGATAAGGGGGGGALTPEELGFLCTPHDLKRLELYARNMVDYHLVTDLLPLLGRLFFLGRVPGVHLSFLQAAILLGVGVQHRSMERLLAELDLPENQLLALFNKAVRKLCTALREVHELGIEAEMAAARDARDAGGVGRAHGAARRMAALTEGMDEELEGGAQAALGVMKARKHGLLADPDMARFAVKGTDQEWEAAVNNSAAAAASGKGPGKEPSAGVHVHIKAAKAVAPRAAAAAAAAAAAILGGGKDEGEDASEPGEGKHGKKKKRRREEGGGGRAGEAGGADGGGRADCGRKKKRRDAR